MFPSQYAGTVLSGTSTEDAVSFGFRATQVRIVNRGPGGVYFNLGSTSPASTGDNAALLTSGEEFSDRVPQCSGAGFTATSTGEVDVMALG